MSRLKVVLVGEGDPSSRDCWSGIGAGLFREFESRGHHVVGLDTSLPPVQRAYAALATLTPNRRRWGVKFHMLDPGRRIRSRIATSMVSKHSDADLIIQFGGTLKLGVPVQHWIYADANIELALEAAQTGHGDAAKLTSSELAEVRRREKAVYDGADGIFAMSERCRSSFIDRFEQPEHSVNTVFAGANYDRLPDGRNGSRPNGPPVILFVGRAFERKGGNLLLEAFAQVRAHVSDAELWIVGPDARGIKQAGVREFGFIDKDVPGGEGRMRELYDGATIFCLPTEYEPFGIAFVEAMLHELPCVGPRSWAVPEIILDEETGLLHADGDPESLTGALVRLLEERTFAERLGQRGRVRALDKFTWQVVVDRMIAAALPEPQSG